MDHALTFAHYQKVIDVHAYGTLYTLSVSLVKDTDVHFIPLVPEAEHDGFEVLVPEPRAHHAPV